ncbi:hypothetical protein JCM11251_002784 [Rhodosporidiobolus azoricus]
MDAQAGPPHSPQPQEPPPLGRRARITHDALLAASNKVIKVLDDKAMRQCFPPRWAEEYPDLIPGLKDMVISTYTAGVPLAWDDLTRSADFVRKANELDEIIADAQARKDKGEVPRELYRLGTDGTVTIPSSTVPQLRNNISRLRAKRQALQEKNALTYQRISALSDRTRHQAETNEAILSQFAASVKALDQVDQSELLKLQDHLVQVVGKDL